MVDPAGLRCQKNTRMLNPAPKNVGGWVPKPPKILSTSLAQWFNKYHAGLEVMGSIPMGDFHI